jgi:ribonuclease-3
LTAIKSIVVSQRTLVRRSREVELDQFLSVGRGMGDVDKLPRSVVANVFEALVGAIYLDRGIEAARQFVLRNLEADIEEAELTKHEENFKSLLQQFAQRDLGCTPTYRVTEEAGPDHAKSFCVVTVIRDAEYGTGWGRNKKEAEQRSARESLAMLKAQLGSKPPATPAPAAPPESPAAAPAEPLAPDAPPPPHPQADA